MKLKKWVLACLHCMLCLPLIYCAQTGLAADIELVRIVESQHLLSANGRKIWQSMGQSNRLIFPPGAQSAIELGASHNVAAKLILLGSVDEQTGSVERAYPVADPVNITFAKVQGMPRLYMLDGNSKQLVVIDHPAACCDVLPGHEDYDFSGQDVIDISGVSVDETTGDVFMLDAAGSKITVVEPDPESSYHMASDNAEGRVRQINIAEDISRARGLALHPLSRHLYMTLPLSKALLEFSQAGALIAIYDLSAFNVSALSGMVFAPSLDRTDDDSVVHLYIVADNRITEYRLRGE